MARSASQDPVEKFRFLVTFLKGQGGILSASNIANNGDPDLSERAGFSEVLMPRVSVREIAYRENINATRPIKAPGLATYEPVTLKRGVTSTRALYNWYTDVNDDALSLNKFTESLVGVNVTPFNNPNFRRDVVISVMDRGGNFVKHWILFNAWPSSYKPGDDLNATTEEKLVEELVLTYESFLEVKGNTVAAAISAAQDEARRSLERALDAAAVSVGSGLIGSLF